MQDLIELIMQLSDKEREAERRKLVRIVRIKKKRLAATKATSVVLS